METWARSPLLILLLAWSTMPRDPGEKLASWLSTANFVAPFLGVAGIGLKCLITGSIEIASGIGDR